MINFKHVLKQLEDHETPYDNAYKNERSDLLNNCMATLSIYEFEALRAQFGFSDVTVANVANRYNVHLETARNWARKAQKKLFVQLADALRFPDD